MIAESYLLDRFLDVDLRKTLDYFTVILCATFLNSYSTCKITTRAGSYPGPRFISMAERRY